MDWYRRTMNCSHHDLVQTATRPKVGALTACDVCPYVPAGTGGGPTARVVQVVAVYSIPAETVRYEPWPTIWWHR